MARLTASQQATVLKAPSNAYALLGVAATATEDELHRAYRRQMKLHHPDLHPDDPGAPDRMVALNQVWDVLSDTQLREAYDWASAQRAAGVTL